LSIVAAMKGEIARDSVAFADQRHMVPRFDQI
jgi:hypothetical protein